MASAPSMMLRSRSVRPRVGAARRGAARRGRRAGVRAAAEKREDGPGGAGAGAGGGAGDGVGGGEGGEGPAPAPAEQLAEAAAGGSWLEGVVNETKLIDWPSRGEAAQTTGVVFLVTIGSAAVLLTLNTALISFSSAFFFPPAS